MCRRGDLEIPAVMQKSDLDRLLTANEHLNLRGGDLSAEPETCHDKTGLVGLHHIVLVWFDKKNPFEDSCLFSSDILELRLIGSRAKGTHRLDSDYDVAVIFPALLRDEFGLASALQLTECLHTGLGAHMPTFRDQKVDLQIFFSDDPELTTYASVFLLDTKEDIEQYALYSEAVAFQNAIYIPGEAGYHDAAMAQWHRHEDFSVASLRHLMEDWNAWFLDEIQQSEQAETSRYAGMLVEPIEEPVVVLMRDGKGYIWDGWHRVAAIIMSGRETIPAIVGKPFPEKKLALTNVQTNEVDRLVLPDENELLVDGVLRPTKNSRGMRISNSTRGIENFWRWFGNSRLVDADGRPLVLFRGQSGRYACTSLVERYLTSDPDYAATYDDGGDICLFSVYVNSENPSVKQNINDVTDWSYSRSALLEGKHDLVCDEEMSIFVAVAGVDQVRSAIGNFLDVPFLDFDDSVENVPLDRIHGLQDILETYRVQCNECLLIGSRWPKRVSATVKFDQTHYAVVLDRVRDGFVVLVGPQYVAEARMQGRVSIRAVIRPMTAEYSATQILSADMAESVGCGM